MIRSVVFTGIVVLLLASCRSTKKITTAIVRKDSVATAGPKIDAPKFDSASFIRETVAKLNANRIEYTTFSGKVNVDYQGTDGKKYDVNANIRMYRDSVIWISVTAVFGIEGLRAYITKDSVKLINKQDKVVTLRSVAYLQEITKLPLSLSTLQEILIGNPVFLDSNIVSFSKNANTVSLVCLGEFFKNLLTLNDENRIENSKLDDVDTKRSRTCNLSYSDYETKKGPAFATKRRITVSEKTNLDIKLDFKSYDFNETLSFPFSVPKNYKSN
ncbi:MAG: DUF4292 domain-containing protein [Chitinophagaceae bacterium]